jgi:hypothetical protein
MKINNFLTTMVLAGVALTSGDRVLAQDPTPQATSNQTGSYEDINLFRKDVRSLKKQIIAANMDLTDTEAQQFWPIYDRYTAELARLLDPKYALLKDYAQNYTTFTSEEAEKYIKGRAAVDESVMKLRLKFFPIFRQVLSGRATALFFQLDWRLGLIIDLQLASQTPFIEP